MKSNLKFVLGLTIALLLLVNVGVVYAAPNTSGIEKSLLEKGFGFITKGLDTLIGGGPILHGLIGGAFSAYNTYQSLSDKINLEVQVDRVNISDKKSDFINKDSYNELVIDPNKDIILTDKNVLDVVFNPTSTDLVRDYKDDSANPTIRVAESTDKINVMDTNATANLGQKRAMLFTDSNQTIADAYEYRTLLIKYTEARYTKQPVKYSIGAGDIIEESWYQIFTTGASQAKSLILDKLFNFENIFSYRNPNPSQVKIQKFHLLFNSRVDENNVINPDLLDCTSEDGKIIGTTGTEVLPKVVYEWKFTENPAKAIAINGQDLTNNAWCDIDKNGVYCDSTQLTIETLQKIYNINKFVSSNSSGFTCPIDSADQPLVNTLNNVGLTYLNATFGSGTVSSANSMTINYKVRGNYQISNANMKTLFDVNYVVMKKSENSFNWVTISTGSKAVNSEYLNTGNIDDTFDAILDPRPIETDTVKVIVTLTDFDSNIANYETGNNAADNTLEMETNLEGTTTGCNLPKTSENIVKYDSDFDESLFNFKANLMKDGYSTDFKKDFDDYYRFTFNTQTPSWYGNTGWQTATDPLYKYFVDAEKFKYKSSFADDIAQTGLPGPGRYNVKILITYDNQWKLFNDAGDMTGKIEVILDKEQAPELDASIYYMPLDGMIGSVDKTRNGYGVDYLDDKVPISLTPIDNYASSMYTEGYVSSNTISTIKTKEVTDFSTMNNGSERGKLLSINRGQNNVLDLRYIPSRATPVVLKVTNSAVNTDAYAFYKLSIGMPINQGGDIANPGMSLAYWTGVGTSQQCNDFTGVPILERFLATPDIVSTESELAPVTQSQSFSYGVEWTKDTIARTGNVWLYTIFYTPSNFRTGPGISYLYIDSANDSAELYTYDDAATGSQSVALTKVYDKDIQSITQIFDLVKTKKACVNYDGSSLEVFYNPKTISDPLTNKIDAQLTSDNACIKH